MVQLSFAYLCVSKDPRLPTCLGVIGCMPAVLTQQTVSPAYVLKLGRWGVSDVANAHPDAAMSVDVAHCANATDWSLMWQLQRNGMPTSLHLMVGLGVFLGLSLVLWHFNGLFVWSFALLMTFILGLATVLHARHAKDQDFIGLRPELLRVETHRAGQVLRWDFNPRWVRIEPRGAEGSLVHLSGHGKSVNVGRFVRSDLRYQLASELRWAVRQLTH
jgi:uncharacterized membrane protein